LQELDISYPQIATAINGDVESLPLSLTAFKFYGNHKIEAKLYPYNNLVR
jgi:prophage DNA circulation protein